jgi:EAL domain-containing protein (putative c-di-GMP-specific phosphodiesterase class I)
VRETDTISRQGGDEFLLVLSDLAGTEAIPPVLLKIRERLQSPFTVDGHELTTSASIGVALYPDDGRDFETLLKKADTAMYRAKDAGRNHYRFFDEQMNIEAVEHLHLKSGLRRALAQGEFELHFQPQFELASGRVVGVEALLRWRHPEDGLIPPARFIPVAEDSGLIVPIGDWVIQEACRQAMAWRAAGLPPLIMAVNLSAVQFRRGEVQQTIAQALQTTGFDPHLLELELTESVLIGDTETVLSSVRQLKQLGVKLSVDDFGTGYSSLSYLKRFDVDKLKIDQSFIRDLASDPDDAAIVRAIVQMAGSLNLRTIAEGVEDPATLALLREFACDEAQGYHFARPMAAQAFFNFMTQRAGTSSSNEKVGMP